MDASRPKRHARDFAPGEQLFDYTDAQSGLRALVLRGPFSFCAYVGVQADHTLAGLEEFEFACHWGITWRSWGDDTFLPANWYWWGWDYGHAFDQVVLDTPGVEAPPELRELLARAQRAMDRMATSMGRTPKDWTLEEVQLHATDVLIALREQLAHSQELAQLALPVAQRG